MAIRLIELLVVIWLPRTHDTQDDARGSPCSVACYADARDNAFAQLMYEHTRAHTSAPFAAWMAELPVQLRREIGGVDVHIVHGSPLAINDFMWESLSDEELELRVRESGAELLLCTHTGIAWERSVAGTRIVNVGAIGRPANDGSTRVRYAVVDLADGGVERVELVALAYDWRARRRTTAGAARDRGRTRSRGCASRPASACRCASR